MRISIVTPSYQSSAWLRLCVSSVADQTGVDVEHLVQDAGSTDGTLDWLLRDNRVTAFVEKDNGMYDAINRGMKRATGDVLAYLNCDEQYLPGVLTKVCKFFDRNPSVEVVFGDAILINENAEPISYRTIVLPGKAHTCLVHLNTMTCATFFRRKIVDRGFLFDQRWRAIGDQVWIYALLKARVQMACMREPLAAFAFTGSNLGSIASSHMEGAQWRAEGNESSPWMLWFAKLEMRMRKLLAGAYRTRNIDVELFTPSSPTKRVRSSVRLGYAWPEVELHRGRDRSS